MSMNRCMTLSHDPEFEIAIVKLHGFDTAIEKLRHIR